VRVGNRRTVIAVVAVVLALVAGTGVYLYTSSADARAKENVQSVQALVATQNIARGTTGNDALSKGLVEKRDVPRGALPPTHVKNPDDIKSKIAGAGIASGQFIVAESFTAEGKGGTFSSGLPKGQMAVSVQVDPKQAVAGRIVEGDTVNVIVAGKARKDPQAPFDPASPDNFAFFAVQNAKVLAIGPDTTSTTSSSSDSSSNSSSDSNTQSTAQQANDRGMVTLQVSAADAERIALAAVTNNAGIWLTLVGPGYTPQNLPFVGDIVTTTPGEPFNQKY
jgi:Flp pilus assembly protein CpaB